MALTFKAFFKGNRKYGIGVLIFDLLMNESHNFSNTVTSHPVEDGSEVADHIRNELFNGTLTGIMTNFSIQRIGLIAGNVALNSFEFLESLWEQRELVDIVTVLKVYNGVAITNISTTRNANTGEALDITVSFQQVKIVGLKTVQIDTSVKIADTITAQNKQSSPQVDQGTQSPVA